MTNKANSTIPKLREELQALEASMQEAVNTSTKATTQTVTSTTPTMQYNSRGANVLELQKKLKAMGLYSGTLDSWWGDLTEKAVRAYQQMNGLVVDGIAGPKTLAALGMFQSTTQTVMSEAAGGIEMYSEAWYSMQAAIDDIKDEISSKYVELFQETQESYENQLSILEQYANKVNNALDNAETRGRLISTDYYKALSNVEKENINIMNQELSALQNSLNKAMNEGQIQKYSAEWWSMTQTIWETQQAIDEANHSLLEYDKTMRELGWEQFSFLQDRIEQIITEADFLIELMSNDKLFEDNGQFNKLGMASMGLNTEAYSILMNQADRYAAEMKRVSKELANDPNNTEILKHYEELRKAQQESIEAAEKRKDAIKSMVEQGIKLEIENLKTLISEYKDGLNSAKDWQQKVA